VIPGARSPRNPAPELHVCRPGAVPDWLGRRSKLTRGELMRSVLLLVLGVPIPVILLLALCTHHL